jgi:hypothetical protein
MADYPPVGVRAQAVALVDSDTRRLPELFPVVQRSVGPQLDLDWNASST